FRCRGPAEDELEEITGRHGVRNGGGLTDYSLQQLVLRLVAMVFLAAVHGLAVAGAACALGDPGPRYDGRLTPHPLSHLDVLGTLAGVFSAGWIKPIAIDPAELRTGRVGLVLVVLAGTAATLAS